MKTLVLQAILTCAALAFACVWASEPFHRSDLRRPPAGSVLAFADADIDAAMAEDEAAGDELDARMARVKSVAADA